MDSTYRGDSAIHFPDRVTAPLIYPSSWGEELLTCGLARVSTGLKSGDEREQA